MKRTILAILATLGMGGIALAFAPGPSATLTARGYVQTSSAVFEKTSGACTIKVMESSASQDKYWITTRGGYRLSWAHAPASHLGEAVDLAEDICLNP